MTEPIFNVPDLEARGAAAFDPDGGPSILQGGQALGEEMVIGTTDDEDFQLIARGGETFLRLADTQRTLYVTPGTGGVDLTCSGPVSVVGNTLFAEADNGAQLLVGGMIVQSDGDVKVGCLDGGVSLESADGENVTVRAGRGGGATGLDVRACGVAAGETGAVFLRTLAAGSDNYAALRAPDALAASFYLTLPIAEPAHEGAALVVNAAGQMAYGPSQQGGIANLTNGVSPTIPVLRMSASTRIFIQCGTATPGAGNLTIGYRPLAADRTNGTPGNFKITAVLNTGAINALDQTQGLMWSVEND